MILFVQFCLLGWMILKSDTVITAVCGRFYYILLLLVGFSVVVQPTHAQGLFACVCVCVYVCVFICLFVCWFHWLCCEVYLSLSLFFFLIAMEKIVKVVCIARPQIRNFYDKMFAGNKKLFVMFWDYIHSITEKKNDKKKHPKKQNYVYCTFKPIVQNKKLFARMFSVVSYFFLVGNTATKHK